MQLTPRPRRHRTGLRIGRLVPAAAAMLVTLNPLASCTGEPSHPSSAPSAATGQTVTLSVGAAIPPADPLETPLASPYGFTMAGDVGDVGFTLTLPANAVFADTEVAAQKIDNVGNYPLTGQPRFAVLFTPAGAQLAAAAELVITSDAIGLEGVDPATIAAWQANADGTDFHLIPFEKVESGIRVRLFELSAVGFGSATEAQRAAVKQPSAALDQVQQEAAKDARLHDPNTRDEAAHAWATRSAQAADAGLDAALADPWARAPDALKNSLAVERERERQGLGGEASAATRTKLAGVVAALRGAVSSRCADTSTERGEAVVRALTVLRVQALLRLPDLTETSGDLTLTPDDALAGCIE